MKKLAFALFALFIFTSCDSHEDFENKVAAEVMPKLEQGLVEKGFEDNNCRIIDTKLIEVAEKDGVTLYRGTVECSTPDVYKPVRVKLFVFKDGDEYTWDTK